MTAWIVLFVAGLAAWLVLLLGLADDPARSWRALLINFLFFAPLAAGMVTWSAIVVCSNGRWPGGTERLAWSGFGFLLPSFLILIGLWIGSSDWAPWYGKTDLKQGFWLDNLFLFARNIGALFLLWACAFWYLNRRLEGRRAAWSSGGTLIAAFCVIFSLVGFDFVMALDPEWYSMVFGAYFFISSLYGAILMWALLVVFEPRYGPDCRHDFGSLILAFGVLTTYFFFIQLLTIWYENLPDETSFTIDRKNYFEWMIVSAVIVGIVYLGPLVMLLTGWAKRNRFFLGGVTMLLLVGLWFERWWLVTPTFQRTPVLGWAELSASAAILGLFGASLQAVRKYLPSVPAEKEGAT